MKPHESNETIFPKKTKTTNFGRKRQMATISGITTSIHMRSCIYISFSVRITIVACAHTRWMSATPPCNSRCEFQNKQKKMVNSPSSLRWIMRCENKAFAPCNRQSDRFYCVTNFRDRICLPKPTQKFREKRPLQAYSLSFSASIFPFLSLPLI